MAVKLLVREIAQANQDIDLLQKPLGDLLVANSTQHEQAMYAAAYNRLVQLIRRLQNAEVSVSGK